ncbi:unnamed protein product [Calypogeia fissa]
MDASVRMAEATHRGWLGIMWPETIHPRYPFNHSITYVDPWLPETAWVISKSGGFLILTKPGVACSMLTDNTHSPMEIVGTGSILGVQATGAQATGVLGNITMHSTHVRVQIVETVCPAPSGVSTWSMYVKKNVPSSWSDLRVDQEGEALGQDPIAERVYGPYHDIRHSIGDVVGYCIALVDLLSFEALITILARVGVVLVGLMVQFCRSVYHRVDEILEC